METIEILRQFVRDELVPQLNLGDLDENQSMFETRILDSLRILKLVVFIETSFDIQVEDEDLIPDNFETLLSIAELISKKNGSPS